MINVQLKPSDNMQFDSSGQFIVDEYASHHTRDMYALPLFLDEWIVRIVISNVITDRPQIAYNRGHLGDW